MICTAAAQIFKSNAIAQRLEERSFLTNKGFELEVAGDKEYLYLDGKVIEEKQTSFDRVIITKIDEKTIYEFKDGLCSYSLIENADGKVETFYEYDDGILKRKRTVRDGVLDNIISYYYQNGRLMAYQAVEGELVTNYLISGSSFSYNMNGSDDAEKIGFYDRLMIKTDTESLDNENRVYYADGLLHFEDGNDGILRKVSYDAEGRIVEEKMMKGDEIVSSKVFHYEDGKLVKEESFSSIDKVINLYRDGILHSKETYVSDEIIKIRYYEENGEYEIKYKNGKPFARLDYDVTGNKVVGLELL